MMNKFTDDELTVSNKRNVNVIRGGASHSNLRGATAKTP